MRIIGADGLKYDAGSGGNVKALDNAPSAYLNDGDVCLVTHIEEGQPAEQIYFYILDEDHGGVENLPLVVVPKDNSASPTDKRWILVGIYQKSINVLDIFANTLSQATSGTPLVLNGTASLSGDRFIFTNPDLTGPPFEVVSQVMVQNLNTEYLGGKHWSDFELKGAIDSGSGYIFQDTDEITVLLPEQRFNTSYSLLVEVQNTVASEPSLMNWMVTRKTMFGFTVKLSSKTDNPYYRLQWAVLGENIDYPEYDLQDIDGNPITDKDGIPFVVF